MSDFVICINNDSNRASLILGKVYRTLADAEAETHKMLRVIDEDKSEPDGYLYTASMFAPIELPEVARRALTASRQNDSDGVRSSKIAGNCDSLLGMSRPLRIEFDGALYHVTSRGDRQEPIYEDDQDRRAFLDVLGSVVERFRWICHAYCLMGNHYHLVIGTPEGNLSKGMRQLNGVYTQISNRRHGRTGHLFQGRYKAILVDRNAYFLEVSRYVVLNAVRAGMVKQPGRWRWSSYKATAGFESCPGWLRADSLLAQFGRERGLARRRYKEFVGDGIGQESLWRNVKGQIFLGDERFVQRTQARLDDGEVNDVNIPRAQRHAPAPGLRQLQAQYKDQKKAMVAAYETGEYSYQQIGNHFGVHFTTVGRIVRGTSKDR